MNEMVERFKAKYGNIVGEAYRGTEQALVGLIQTSKSYLVFYPDGTMDRFEPSNGQVTYRDGFVGPDIKYQEEPKAAPVVKERVERTAKRRTKAPRDTKDALWARQRAYADIQIPEPFVEFMSRAEKAFNEVVAALNGEMKVYDTAESAFRGILDCGFFHNVVSDFTWKDVRDLKDLPERFHLYLGAKFVGE